MILPWTLLLTYISYFHIFSLCTCLQASPSPEIPHDDVRYVQSGRSDGGQKALLNRSTEAVQELGSVAGHKTAILPARSDRPTNDVRSRQTSGSSQGASSFPTHAFASGAQQLAPHRRTIGRMRIRSTSPIAVRSRDHGDMVDSFFHKHRRSLRSKDQMKDQTKDQMKAQIKYQIDDHNKAGNIRFDVWGPEDENQALYNAKVTASGIQIQIQPSVKAPDYPQWLNRIVKLPLHDYLLAERKHNNKMRIKTPWGAVAKSPGGTARDNVLVEWYNQQSKIMKMNDQLRRGIYNYYHQLVKGGAKAASSFSLSSSSSEAEEKEDQGISGSSHQAEDKQTGMTEHGTGAGTKKKKKKKKKKKQG